MTVVGKRMFEHELIKRHHYQIVRRAAELRASLYPIWAVTWRPGDRTESFLGKLFRPLGNPLMMAQVGYPLPDDREGIAVFGIKASVDPATASVSYDSLRIKHDLHLRPRIDGAGNVLDPRDEVVSSRGKGSWLHLALRVERLRARHSAARQLPIAPRLPQVYLGFGHREAIRFEVTPELWLRAAAELPSLWTGRSFQELVQRQGPDERQLQALAQLAGEEQAARLRAVWEAAIVSPGDAANPTGLWLVPHELTTDVYGTTRVFEYFGDLVGVPVLNPARGLARRPVSNPSVELAAEAGFDLLADLASLSETEEGSPAFRAIEERILGLVLMLRARVRASDAISDEDLLGAICDPEQRVAVAPALDTLPEAEQVRLMRGKLASHVSVCCSDADLLGAAQQPNGPLWASGMCRVQLLQRDMAVSLEEALIFSPERLGRDRVSAKLWFDAFRPEARRPQLTPAPYALAG